MSTPTNKLRTALAAKAQSAIKKSKHNQQKKPYSEVSYGMDVNTAYDLMTGFAPSSNTKQMTKWSLAGPQVADLFPESKFHISHICPSLDI